MRIDHIGSTAVPGLAAKPIVDIQISVAAFEPLGAFRAQLEGLGYVFRAGDQERTKRYLPRTAGQPPHPHPRSTVGRLIRLHGQAHRERGDPDHGPDEQRPAEPEHDHPRRRRAEPGAAVAFDSRRSGSAVAASLYWGMANGDSGASGFFSGLVATHASNARVNSGRKRC